MSDEQQGCIYKEREGVPTCKKLCGPGQKMCPHHTLLVSAQADQKEQRERKRKAEAERAKGKMRRR